MNEIEVVQKNLPATLPELSKFVLIGREKLTAVRAEIRAIEKVGLAQEVREQKLKEAQAIAEAVLDAEVRIGELMEKMPKAKENQYTKMQTDSGVVRQKPKTEVIREAGFSPKQAERFQTIAKHPEAVKQAKAEAREQDEVVTRPARCCSGCQGGDPCQRTGQRCRMPAEGVLIRPGRKRHKEEKVIDSTLRT